MMAEIAHHMAEMVAEMIMSIETRMIPMKVVNLLKNNLYSCSHRLLHIVSSEWQQ